MTEVATLPQDKTSQYTTPTPEETPKSFRQCLIEDMNKCSQRQITYEHAIQKTTDEKEIFWQGSNELDTVGFRQPKPLVAPGWQAAQEQERILLANSPRPRAIAGSIFQPAHAQRAMPLMQTLGRDPMIVPDRQQAQQARGELPMHRKLSSPVERLRQST